MSVWYRLLPVFVCLAVVWSPAALSHPLEPAAQERISAPRPTPRLPTFTVDGDIAALRVGGLPAHEAGYRLIARGSENLPKLHAALLARSAEPAQRLQLVTVLAEIGDASSVTPLVEAAGMLPDSVMLQGLVAARLGRMPASAVSFDFLASKLDDKNTHPYVRRAALAALGQQRDVRCSRWANRFLEEKALPELQAVSLVCLARIGDSAVAKPITALVQAGELTEVRLLLMYALAELVNPETFSQSIGPGAARSVEFLQDYQSALRYAQLRWLPEDGKAEIAAKMLEAKHAVEKQLAAQYLIDAGRTDVLERFAQSTRRAPVYRLVHNELRRAGYLVAGEGDSLRIVAPQGDAQ